MLIQGGALPTTLKITTPLAAYQLTAPLGVPPVPAGTTVFGVNVTTISATGVASRFLNYKDAAQTQPLAGTLWGSLGV